MRKTVSFLSRFVPLVLLFAVWSAQAALTVGISPSGTVSANNVRVVVTVTSTTRVTPTLSVRLNGVDVSATFNQVAAFNTTGNTTTATIEYLFAGGTYAIAATAQAQGESPASASTSFTVPGDEQTSRKNTVIARITEFLHQWDSFDFRQWSSAGNPAIFSARMSEPTMEVYVDPSYLGDTAGQYVELYKWKQFWTIYDQDLVLPFEPQNDNVTSGTLWHEMIHAVSHGAQLRGAANRLTGDDHVYIGWAESCVIGFTKLRSFENRAKQYGIGNPNQAQATDVRNIWRLFLTDARGSLYPDLGIPTAAQKTALQNLIGFSCDPAAIRAGYISAGYSPLYFADVRVSITSPATGTQVSGNQTQVTASVINNEPGLVIEQAGFSVNGAIQLAGLANNSFNTTAVLRTGTNTILAGVRTTDGQTFTSTPITVTSTAANNTYHARITWDKDGTDVDLNFSWSGGAECYYGNKTPTWGTAATSPRLDVDDTNGFGPENITIGGLPGPGTYRLGVHYYSDHGKGPTNVTATVFTDGAPVFSGSKTMSSGENWTLLEFTVPQAGRGRANVASERGIAAPVGAAPPSSAVNANLKRPPK
jgi:uncharacterized protein YfaP (DUF2135 family)